MTLFYDSNAFTSVLALFLMTSFYILNGFTSVLALFLMTSFYILNGFTFCFGTFFDDTILQFKRIHFESSSPHNSFHLSSACFPSKNNTTTPGSYVIASAHRNVVDPIDDQLERSANFLCWYQCSVLY